MMTILRYIPALLFLFVFGCQEPVGELDTLEVPTALELDITVDTSGSGIVNFQATAQGAMSYHYYFGNAPGEDPVVSMDGSASNTYRRNGLNTYRVKVIAFGRAGISSSVSEEIEVRVDFEVPTEILTLLTGGSTKTWNWKSSEPGHLGVGPVIDGDGNPVSEPIWYTAAPEEKAAVGCLYEDDLTFTLTDNGNVLYLLDNKGSTYFHVDELEGATGIPSSGSDECADYTAPGESVVLFAEAGSGVSPSTNILMQIGGSGYMSYYVNSSEYEIMSISEDELRVRTIQNGALAWYHIFTSGN